LQHVDSVLFFTQQRPIFRAGAAGASGAAGAVFRDTLKCDVKKSRLFKALTLEAQVR